jgi:hypothetical protein
MIRILRRFVVPFSAVVVMMVSGAPAARALDLATFDIRDQMSGVGDMTGVRVTILDQMFGPGTSPHYQLFETYNFTPADVGSTFILTSANDPDFATFEQMITNGVNDSFGDWVDNLPSAGGLGTTSPETNLFAPGTHSFGPGNFTSIGQLSGPDFAGYDITQVVLTINSFSLTSGSGFYSADFRATATIVAAPEPGCTGLLVFGTTALGLVRRRRA